MCNEDSPNTPSKLARKSTPTPHLAILKGEINRNDQHPQLIKEQWTHSSHHLLHSQQKNLHKSTYKSAMMSTNDDASQQLNQFP